MNSEKYLPIYSANDECIRMIRISKSVKAAQLQVTFSKSEVIQHFRALIALTVKSKGLFVLF